MSSLPEQDNLIDRREAIRRVSALLGGVALVGGSALLTGCRDDRPKEGGTQQAAGDAAFSAEDVALLDEVAETILPETKTPGAKAAKVGAFMALMVTDTYDARDQRVFRDGMRKLDEASRKAGGASFMQATPQARLALLESLDREQKSYTDARQARAAAKVKKADATGSAKAKAEAKEEVKAADPATANKSDAYLPDQRQENAVSSEVGSATAISEDAPAHYFRMMKELALLGYFMSEIGYTKAQRYVEAPGRYDPCVPYKVGDRAWAPHA